ncbi:uncharacterized protein LOC123291779 [Chrysoperla carnea]|uniref:uncharacterized protein LOC123291779 n=1 Tax=Chrysoperla carnea TaxID=189513 RepID=UPI001D094F2E|nr:uncharacterized protein LOC123291779 [Chrysoperla carnea]
MPGDDDQVTPTPSIDRVSVKLPPFWKTRPQYWFVQAEANFHLANITSDSSKYNYVISVLDESVFDHVGNILTNPPETQRYETLKKQLLSAFTDNERMRIRKLLTDLSLGDRKPTHLLQEMRQLAGDHLDEDFFKSLWLQRLPHHAQTILAASNEALPQLAKMADSIMEVQPAHGHAVNAVNITKNTTTQNRQTTIDDLIKKLENIETRLVRMERRSRSSSRNRDTKSPRSASPADPSVCWYHTTYAEKATKCRKPCKYVQQNKESASN